jgi:hypothetical protein
MRILFGSWPGYGHRRAVVPHAGAGTMPAATAVLDALLITTDR